MALPLLVENALGVFTALSICLQVLRSWRLQPPNRRNRLLIAPASRLLRRSGGALIAQKQACLTGC